MQGLAKNGKGKMAKNHIPYFRFYPGDFMRGVRGLTPQETGLYVMLLCRMYEESGPIENHTLKLSTYCGMRLATFGKTLDRLIALDKITVENGFLFNDRAATEISSRAHDLKIASKAGKASAEKRQQNQGDTSTTVERPLNHTDTDTDTEEVKREAKASPKSGRGSRLPDGWFLPVTWGEWAITEGLVSDEIRSEADKFRDYWIGVSGAKGCKADWQATWRNWIRKYIADNRKAKANGKTDRRQFDAAITETARRLSAGTIHIDYSSRDPFHQR